ncbi:T9SS type A sorting domain-containing protein [Adhaeribacter sp. BT258]|uniref:T9SS type A sorting domain-containing protein n=1 Tax=Adhaeribacter terrigena TaxID=2793070 RepID=A0ABS1C3F7_9BACT|nr:T9SS type A sorting domain-containing protein [Adhaeribacter terrigena]MBK0403875.1 T9SS type A sorting domain-containing protein [Adhaeribacter terrigena]
MSIFLGFSAQAQWISKPLGFSSDVLVYEMEAVDDNVIWAAGSDDINPAGQAYMKSVDGGNTWQSGMVTNPQDQIINNITAINASTAWVAMVSDTLGGGMIKKTSNGGQTWVNQGSNTYTNANSYPSVIHFFDANNGVVFGDPVGGYFEVYHTNNGGSTWVRVPAASLPAILSGSNGDEYVMFAKAAVSDTIWVGTSEGRILRSVNKGLSWTAANTSLFGIQAVAFTDGNNGLAMSNMGELAKTTNGGLTWTNVMFQGDIYDYDMAAMPRVPGVFVTTGFNSSGFAGSSFTTDGGLNWATLDSMPHMAVAFASVNAGWTSGVNSRVSYQWSGGALGVSEPNTVQAALLYPNPSTGTLYLAEPGITESLFITDLTGREVFSSGKGVSRAAVDLSGLPKGVYLVTLKAGKIIKRQKLVLQ